MNISRYAAILIITSAAIITGGCVERRLTINTDPPGSIVELNDEEVGVSPVTVDFNWYGDYKVRIRKEGYETLNTHRKLKAPLHDRFPFDFFADVLWPGTIRDEYEWTFELEEYSKPDRDKLVQHADQLRERAKEQIEQEL